MPKLTYGLSGAGITLPAGRYTAKFLGTEDRDPIQESKFGNEGAPRMAWLFEVLDGPKKGEVVAQETGVRASKNSSCARVIMGLAGGQVNAGQQIDTDQFVGKVYSLKIAPNPNSERGNLYVADIDPQGDGVVPGAVPGAVPAQQAKPAGGPPPRRSTQQSAPPVTATYYVDDPKYPSDKPQDAEEVRRHLFATGQKAEQLMLCRVGDPDWKPASEYGFETSPI